MGYRVGAHRPCDHHPGGAVVTVVRIAEADPEVDVAARTRVVVAARTVAPVATGVATAAVVGTIAHASPVAAARVPAARIAAARIATRIPTPGVPAAGIPAARRTPAGGTTPGVVPPAVAAPAPARDAAASTPRSCRSALVPPARISASHPRVSVTDPDRQHQGQQWSGAERHDPPTTLLRGDSHRSSSLKSDPPGSGTIRGSSVHATARGIKTQSAFDPHFSRRGRCRHRGRRALE